MVSIIHLAALTSPLYSNHSTSQMYFQDPISAVTNVDDYSGSARLLAATTLRNVLGTRNLGDILSDRESIAQEMQVLHQQHGRQFFKFILRKCHLF